jgi:hypothetical protein
MRQIILSQEFQLFSPILIVVLVFFITWIIFLAIKIIQYYNRQKFVKELEKFMSDTGENTMKLDGKTIFEDAMKRVLPTGGTGNQTRQVKLLMGVMQGLSSQSVGMVQKMRQLALIQAASAEMNNGNEIIQAVDEHIAKANDTFESESPVYVASALGNDSPDASLPAIGERDAEKQATTTKPAESETVQAANPGVEKTTDPGLQESIADDESLPMNEAVAKSIMKNNAVLRACLRTHVQGSIMLQDFELRNMLLEEMTKLLQRENDAGTLCNIERGKELLEFLQGMRKPQ